MASNAFSIRFNKTYPPLEEVFLKKSVFSAMMINFKADDSKIKS
jgi:hypothetical protein